MRSRSLNTPRKLLPVEDQDCSDMEIRHTPGHFGHGIPLLYEEKLTVVDNVSDSGH